MYSSLRQWSGLVSGPSLLREVLQGWSPSACRYGIPGAAAYLRGEGGLRVPWVGPQAGAHMLFASTRAGIQTPGVRLQRLCPWP